MFVFIFPSPPRRAALKEAAGSVGGLAAAAPFGPVFDDPIGQGAFEADVATSLLGFNPLVAHDFLTFGQEFPVERGVFHELIT